MNLAICFRFLCGPQGEEHMLNICSYAALGFKVQQ